MNRTKAFALSALTASMLLAGCGGDINLTPTSIDNSVNEGGGSTPDTNNCASYESSGTTIRGEKIGADCVYPRSFSTPESPVTSDIRLVELPGGAHIFPNGLYIGENVEATADVNREGPTLTIDAGVTLAFEDGDSFVRIARGANIMADGNRNAPITFTSVQEVEGFDIDENARGLWGGIVINGFGISNKCDQNDLANCVLQGEGGAGFYGGDDNADDSGVLRYALVKYAGYEVSLDNELNGITFNAVGSGTTLEYIQVHNNLDDGIEFFGGAANVKNVVLTGNDDDSLDWADGWQGKIQYILVKHADDRANRAIEADGNSGNNDATPYSDPIIANFTSIGSLTATDGSDESEGVLVREGTHGALYNFVITEARGECLEIDDAATLTAAANGDLSIQNSVIACTENFKDTDTQNWFEAGTGNVTLSAGASVLTSGYITASDMADASGAPVTVTPKTDLSSIDPFFDDVDFIGAVSEDDDWTNGWTVGLRD
ncbi:hypothetical protein CWE21_08865 [Pseudidiomarina aquimaris]|uniref:Right handed beta helix domain-containing protein n=1 Tax=Pseudidiomarina aquimaris TaxID=641841 RepID=A0A432XF53_9GAMM|nr:hypothetical protein [Pseudidiomarina aquimaris]RUO47290.1 hypothetical protein CWE21_08865 [Pseudidiomarina aquimaris]